MTPVWGADPVLRVQREIARDAYDTDLPLIVAERCRDAGRYDDGTRAEPDALVAIWYALRWLMATFPERPGFGQRAIADIAGVNQKTVQKRLRKLFALELITEAGRRTFSHLTGKDGAGKVQIFYTIPVRKLREISAAQAPTIIAAWELRLFGGAPSGTPILPDSVESQLTLDLSDPATDQALDPSTDQSDPATDQALDPSTDQSDPATDQALDPATDQALDPLRDHMGRKEGRKEGVAHVIASRSDSDPPTAPPGMFPLESHPRALWALVLGAPPGDLDAHLLAQLAAEHDGPTGGHGWYWVGRALLAVAMGGAVQHGVAAVRKVLRRWREGDSYGSDAPAGPQRPSRPAPPGPPSAPLPPGSGRVSDSPISLAQHITGSERQAWLRRFRTAADPLAQRAILAQFASAHPLPGAPPAAPSPEVAWSA